MKTLKEIERAVGDLPERDYSEFRTWFLEHDWAKWDREIESDAAAGKLDFLVNEAREAKAKGVLKNL